MVGRTVFRASPALARPKESLGWDREWIVCGVFQPWEDGMLDCHDYYGDDYPLSPPIFPQATDVQCEQ